MKNNKSYSLITVAFSLLGFGTSYTVKAINNNHHTSYNDPLNFDITHDKDNSISIVKKHLSDNKYELEAIIKPENQSNPIKWTTSHENLISIKPNGKHCEIEKKDDYRGSVKITCTVGKLKCFINVTIKEQFYIENVELINTTCPQMTDGTYYSEEKETMELKVTYTGNMIKTLNEANISPLSTFEKYTSQLNFNMLIDICKTYLPFMTTGTYSALTYNEENRSVSFNLTVNIGKSTQNEYNNNYFSMSFIEFVDIESLSLDHLTLELEA